MPPMILATPRSRRRLVHYARMRYLGPTCGLETALPRRPPCESAHIDERQKSRLGTLADVRCGSRLCENLTDAMIPLLNRGGMMKGFVQGADRQQTTLLPECLDDWVDESNPVRAVDVFVDALELRELGFDGVTPAATGRPGYHPSPLLKLYIYGYLNRVQSSRRLEREAGRNLEAM